MRRPPHLSNHCRRWARGLGFALVLPVAGPVAGSLPGAGMAGGISPEPLGSPLRGDQRAGLSGERAQARRGWIADVVVPSPSERAAPAPAPETRRRWDWREGYGVLPPRVRPWFVRPPATGDNVNKRYNPVPPSSSLRNQSIEDPTLNRDP